MVDCSGWIQPLDLECIFVNTFSGSMDIFMGVAFLVIAILAGKFKMMNITIALMYGLFVILTTWVFTGWLLLMLLITSFGIAYWFSKTVKQ
jgi:hypothetical protein